MNYRHAFHAGNFADVFKHVVLTYCLQHLVAKPAPFRVIDTHAGIGRYDIAGSEAGRTLEWADGIGRLIGVDAPPAPAAVEAALAPYLDVVRAANSDGRLSVYPGSPMLALAALRSDDRLIANELHPEDRAALAALFKGEARVTVMGLDGWTAVKSLLPPKERRGLLFVDPPFEAPGEFERMARAVAEARKRFASGTMIFWYPLKHPADAEPFFRAVAKSALEKWLRAELLVRAPVDPSLLNGCGVYVVNPPWTLAQRLETVGPFLADRLAKGPGAAFSLTAAVA
jgi:23S rRNA (adenine2030-N6)-methyltransferase